MNIEESVYHKCGEIYFSDSKTYSFLCYYCHELFDDFKEFCDHCYVHLDELESDTNDTDDIDTTLKSKNEICESVQIERNQADDLEFEEKDEMGSHDEKDESQLYNQSEIEINCSDNASLNELESLDKHEEIDRSIEESECDLKAKNKNLAGEQVSNSISCSYCNSTFENDSHNIQKCKEVTDLIQKYDGHFLELLREGILCCSECYKYFEDYKCLYEHHLKEKHCIGSAECKICQFYSFMNTQVKTKPNCNTAKYEALSKKGWDLEQSDENSTDDENTSVLEPYKCSTCERVFSARYKLKMHLRVHSNEKPFQCKLCPASFRVSSYLKTHVIYKHTKEKPFVCEYEGCDASFKFDSLKKQHEKRHLPANVQCEMCGNYYKSKFNLIKHQRSKHVDSENWPYKCDICEKKFAHTEYLTIHKRIHSGEKPYGCNVCSKYFACRSTLRKHKKTHTENEKYVCRICGKRFKQVASCFEHMKRHSNES